MPLFAPLSQAERKALQASSASTIPQQLAALLQQHHTRVIDLFRALDKNADGEVTRPELADALLQLGVEATDDEVDELFDRLDPDHSGGIVFRELQKALSDATREGNLLGARRSIGPASSPAPPRAPPRVPLRAPPRVLRRALPLRRARRAGRRTTPPAAWIRSIRRLPWPLTCPRG